MSVTDDNVIIDQAGALCHDVTEIGNSRFFTCFSHCVQHLFTCVLSIRIPHSEDKDILHQIMRLDSKSVLYHSHNDLMLPTRQSTTRYCKEEMVVFGLVHLLGNFLFETVCRFESRDVVSRKYDSGVLTDVAGCLLGPLLHDKTSESTEIYVFAVCEAVLHNGHELFDNGNNRTLVDAGCLCDFTRYFCFSHFLYCFEYDEFLNAKLIKIAEFRNELPAQRRLWAAEIFDKMKVTEVLCSVTFIADMALARSSLAELKVGYALLRSAIIFLLALMIPAICSVYSHIPLANARHWIMW